MPYSALRDKKQELIRKARDGSVFIAPKSAALLASITTGSSADLVTLPTDWKDLGWMSTAGATYGRTTESSQVQSFGSTEPTREDITRDTITMQVVAQETSLLTLGLYTGIDTTNLKAAFTTGEVQIEKPNLPNPRYYHALGLFVDQSSDGEIYLARYMPNARITEFGEQQYGEGDDPISYPMTFTGFDDSTAGFSHKWFFGGPGWLALLDAMGIDQATS
ncbi:hypothetical protein [Micromonospora maritima]|uniref:phage tail tube protein n=1 Tax=Micromonospora maritima TaxID=986711 RepID=UPI00157C04E5|nr:hypothetical protein [Micromonospora maritima]